MLSQTIRHSFIEYFKKKKHTAVPSSSVIPHDDPTLLFTNAGMNQFKDLFLGNAKRDYTRAVTSQKCIRAGGKHNDLENVGHTARHLTFFEMLGNFSFGDYFKKEAIAMAYEVATEVFGFEKEKIWPTIFTDDDEAHALWSPYFPDSKIIRLGEKDNFWAMGETGPCGPCSELYYDRGPAYGSATHPGNDLEGTRFIEFWNLVFMQYNRSADGKMSALPKQSIDTGAGLERIVCLKMGVDSVFETDVLQQIIQATGNLCNRKYDKQNSDAAAFHVIADHLRTLSFAISDGAQPSNVERGYVLRKILRRAVRYGKQLGFDEPFLAQLLPTLLQSMGTDYPELVSSEKRTAEILTSEENAFFRTLKRGGNLLANIIDKAKDKDQKISGDDAFVLKDTYGLPLEEILLIARDHQLSVDQARFETLQEEAKERSKSAHKTTQQQATNSSFATHFEKHGASVFVGYDNESTEATVVGLFAEGSPIDQLTNETEGLVLLDATPFYAEKGGQVGDHGFLKNETTFFEVKDCQQPYNGLIAHVGRATKGALRIGDKLIAAIDAKRRRRIANNHTATHLLHFALQKILGAHIKQAGSVVDDERLRFDFNHHKPLSLEEIIQIEDLVNEKIRDNKPVSWYEIAYEEAQKTPQIKQFFGEKYGSKVRVVDIDYSKELCGGTHTDYVGTIGYFRILKEGSISAGVRRIEAVTGVQAEGIAKQDQLLISQLAATLKTQPEELSTRIKKLQDDLKEKEQQLKQWQKKELQSKAKELLNGAVHQGLATIVISQVDVTLDLLRPLLDEITGQAPAAFIGVVAASDGKRCQIQASISKELVQKGIKASDLIKQIAPLIEGQGGGKDGSAQAGGQAPQGLPAALKAAKEWATKLC